MVVQEDHMQDILTESLSFVYKHSSWELHHKLSSSSLPVSRAWLPPLLVISLSLREEQSSPTIPQVCLSVKVVCFWTDFVNRFWIFPSVKCSNYLLNCILSLNTLYLTVWNYIYATNTWNRKWSIHFVLKLYIKERSDIFSLLTKMWDYHALHYIFQ